MRFGLVARADDRGLGIQTWEVARNLRPDRVLIVEMPDHQQRHVRPHYDRYVDLGMTVVVVPSTSMGDESVVGPWLDGLDVVYSAETFYDWSFCDIARKHGARTVLHANPEFWLHWRYELPWPDEVWHPTTWLLDHEHMPRGRVVPMPVPIDRWPEPRRIGPGETVSFLHIAGHMAMADRNGTRALFVAMRNVRQPMRVTVTTQMSSMHRPSRLPRHVSYTPVVGNRPDYWRLYAGHDVLVMPRRYGGLCLPVNEAMGAGLAVIMTDVEPNRYWWPAAKLPVEGGDTIPTQLGDTWSHRPSVSALAEMMDTLASDHGLLLAMQEHSREWAEEHSWDALADDWRSALDAVVRA